MSEISKNRNHCIHLEKILIHDWQKYKNIRVLQIDNWVSPVGIELESVNTEIPETPK